MYDIIRSDRQSDLLNKEIVNVLFTYIEDLGKEIDNTYIEITQGASIMRVLIITILILIIAVTGSSSPGEGQDNHSYTEVCGVLG